MGNSEKGHIYIPHLEQNNLPFSSFRWCLSRNRLTINATTYTFLERSFRDLSRNVWVVALIVTDFEINAKNETEMILLKWRVSLKSDSDMISSFIHKMLNIK